MSLPVAICCHVYLKSSEVIGWLSDHTAAGLMLYVMVCLPLTCVTVGGLAIRMLGTFCQAQFTSCSAPRTSVPLPLVGAAAAFVVDEVLEPPPPLEPLELPQAASTMAR